MARSSANREGAGTCYLEMRMKVAGKPGALSRLTSDSFVISSQTSELEVKVLRSFAGRKC